MLYLLVVFTVVNRIVAHQLIALCRNGIKPQAAPNMISILDNSALDDFIITAEMDDEEADVHRVHQNDVFLVEPSTHKQKLK